RRLADVWVQRDDGVDRRVGLQLGLYLRLRRREVGRALHLDVLDGTAEALLHALAALLEADVVLLVDDAEHLLDAGRLEALAGGAAGDDLVLPDVRDRAEGLGVRLARVEGDDRDAGGLRLRQRGLDRVRVGDRDREAGDLLRDG